VTTGRFKRHRIVILQDAIKMAKGPAWRHRRQTMNRLFATITRLARIAVPIFVLCVASSLWAQTLQITSPANRSMVSPGQRLKVTVVESPSGAFRYVSVAGQNPIGFGPGAKAPPYELSVQIPARISPRLYALTAVGIITPGHPIFSTPIMIDVERPDAPMSLDAEPGQLWLGIGGVGIIRVIGRFSDDPDIDLTQSTLTEYSSSALDVATVDKYGRVTGVAPGSALITTTNRGTTVVVPITVAKR
jgi:hypothetical protein